jgi:uncharacterized membrane protein HdeD (DUF308 family)
MKKILHKAWVHLFMAGTISFLFGIVILFIPEIPLLTLIELFAAYMLMKGLALVLGAWRARKEDNYWLFLLSYGVLNIITGIVAYKYVQITLIILGFIVSFNLLISGILQIVMAIHLHKEIRRADWLILSGAITLIAGTYIYFIPRIGALTIFYLIAGAALVLSIFLILLSLKASQWKDTGRHPIMVKN